MQHNLPKIKIHHRKSAPKQKALPESGVAKRQVPLPEHHYLALTRKILGRSFDQILSHYKNGLPGISFFEFLIIELEMNSPLITFMPFVQENIRRQFTNMVIELAKFERTLALVNKSDTQTWSSWTNPHSQQNTIPTQDFLQENKKFLLLQVCPYLQFVQSHLPLFSIWKILMTIPSGRRWESMLEQIFNNVQGGMQSDHIYAYAIEKKKGKVGVSQITSELMQFLRHNQATGSASISQLFKVYPDTLTTIIRNSLEQNWVRINQILN